MTKNWQEEFDRLEMNDRSSKGCSVCLAEMIGGKNMNILYEFITNLRKHDEEELIKMLPVKNGRTEQLIKDYYAK